MFKLNSFMNRDSALKQFDKFLNEIQKEKMKELWNNCFDEEWEKT